VKLKFWQEACPVECIKHVKKLVIHEFKGNKNEHVFIMFIGEKAHVLDKLVIMLCFESFYCSKSSLDTRMRPFLTVKWSSKLIKITFKISRVLLGIFIWELMFHVGTLLILIAMSLPMFLLTVMSLR
jgi:hypothetical protein